MDTRQGPISTTSIAVHVDSTKNELSYEQRWSISSTTKQKLGQAYVKFELATSIYPSLASYPTLIISNSRNAAWIGCRVKSDL